VFVAADASGAIREVVEQAAQPGVRVEWLSPGVAERLGSTVAPQGVFALVKRDKQRATDAFAAADFVVIADRVSDPGNAGTLWRSAAAAGADAYLLGRGSVDAYNPKLVRATAGACFSVPVIDDVDVADALERCGARGLVRVGAVVTGGATATPDAVDLSGPVAVVLGHEARGLSSDLPLDVTVTIPMAAGTESLNLAMAGTVLCFEVARQRRAVGRGPA
jgi:TrmH family RNA methyltransferase